MARIPDVAAIARDPLWLAHRYDPVHDAIHFLKLTRDDHRAAIFLTDEYLPADAEKVILRRDESVTAAQAAPLHFIFHSAYCCSTMLARAFDVPGAAIGLKEPVILNDLVGWRRRGADPRKLTAILGDTLTLLARPFGKSEAVVVKPSNIVNGMAAAMLAMRPGSRALLLHAPLRTYLASIAKKGMWGRLWVRELFTGQLKDGLVDLGFDDEQLLRLTDLQVAAAGWLVQHALFARLLAQFGPTRVMSLDSETLVARPEDTMRALGVLFDIDLDAQAIAAGPAFSRHSKLDQAFGGEARAAEHSNAVAAHAEEIDKVAAWAEAVAANAGIALELSTQLLPLDF